MCSKEKFYITTAIAYTSKKPHIGNTYEIILTDAIARFKRFMGYDVFFLTGTDEHGQKIQELAEQEGITPQEHVDNIAAEIRRIADMLDVSYDKFIRTTDDYHQKAVQKIFTKLYEQGDIYKSEYEGWYCTPCESFWTDTQLENGKCPDCGREVHKTKEEAYFFKMSKYQDRLMKHIEENPGFIQPESRKKEMVNNFLKPGLQDLCVSRTSFSWGIPVEFDKKHIIYVWIDALSNYITALGYTPDGKSELYNKYWPADIHVIGKDILRFHTIYWPIMLMALGEPLPKQIFGHPWLLRGEEKMSKSRGNVIYADDLANRFGVDAVRYYSLHEMPFAQDGNITYEVFISRYNSDLANTLGNLVNRTVSMINKYFGGEIMPGDTAGEFDDDLKAVAAGALSKVSKKMETLHVADSLDEIWKIVNRANKYIDETTPWILAKDEKDRPRLGTVLYNLTEAIRIIASLLSPFMPETSEKIKAQINAEDLSAESAGVFGITKPGTRVGTAEPIFARIDAEKMLKELEDELGGDEEPQVEIEPFKDEIAFDDFEKLDIRVGKVLKCEKVPKSSKLLRFELECGSETRQILSGIAKFCKPEEMIGKNVLFIANLPVRKIMGLESCGMILSAEHGEELRVLTTLGDIHSGAVVV
ncbi:MAG TPA: methionine--tRNA ligase [Candidatus Monoglobus merdigallinarum]|uniref:Methionine--tRNA ligase n=1 Tax=Candidatus Monoglobus merdigallinarum TaxID=2838698 RepID=A0A9D1PPE1_9FIRM|nr:methionine--tRNA ligase [Candidatus Monoglobus merdigallinarum]